MFSSRPIAGNAMLIADPIKGVRNELKVVIKRIDFFPCMGMAYCMINRVALVPDKRLQRYADIADKCAVFKLRSDGFLYLYSKQGLNQIV
ncbi:MAG: hypothetical protein IPH20_02030 [Bacteroidales bacterium]|nr:hypothetical protein [Bacteroidales bacterium]